MRNRFWTAATYCLLLLVCCVAAWDVPASGGDPVAIIVNPSNTTSNVSLGDLNKIFLGEKSRWPNGKHIFLIMAPPGSPERAAILKSVYKMSETDYAKYFLQASFTGAISAPPKDAASAAEIKQLVASNPGAIGYVKQEDVDDTVKVLLKIP
jgi:ABC-type phosphate transport system substrate-binding protein